MRTETVIQELYKFYNISPRKEESSDYIAEISRRLIKSNSGDSNYLLQLLSNNLKEEFINVNNLTKNTELSYRFTVGLEGWNNEEYMMNIFISKLAKYYTFSTEKISSKKTIDTSNSVLNDILYLLNKHGDEFYKEFGSSSDERKNYLKEEKNRSKLILILETIVLHHGSEIGIKLVDFRISDLYESLLSFQSKISHKNWINNDLSIKSEIDKIVNILLTYFPYQYLPEDILFTTVNLDNYSREDIILNLMF